MLRCFIQTMIGLVTWLTEKTLWLTDTQAKNWVSPGKGKWPHIHAHGWRAMDAAIARLTQANSAGNHATGAVTGSGHQEKHCQGRLDGSFNETWWRSWGAQHQWSQLAWESNAYRPKKILILVVFLFLGLRLFRNQQEVWGCSNIPQKWCPVINSSDLESFRRIRMQSEVCGQFRACRINAYLGLDLV